MGGSCPGFSACSGLTVGGAGWEGLVLWPLQTGLGSMQRPALHCASCCEGKDAQLHKGLSGGSTAVCRALGHQAQGCGTEGATGCSMTGYRTLLQHCAEAVYGTAVCRDIVSGAVRRLDVCSMSVKRGVVSGASGIQCCRWTQ